MTDPATGPGDVTSLLLRWQDGDERAFDVLLPLVYDELRQIARRQMRSERDATLEPTALVHEAYLRLVGADVTWEGRRHFLAVAARAMRRTLVDRARARSRDKRGGEARPVTLEEGVAMAPMASEELLALDEALERLAAHDPRKARLVELHHFGGLSYADAAEVVGISTATVHRELRLARAWLHHALRGGDDDATA
jgi:RNA polymerase sigma factor (TIGR02999 family)